MNVRIQNLLKSLGRTQNKYWNIDRKTGQFLNLLIKDRNFKTVFEIGTSNGYSGIWLAEALNHNNGKLFTMESHKKERFSLAQENFKKAKLKNIIQILGHAPEDIPATPAMIDLAFFDATKQEYLSYFNKLKSRVKKGGIIVADNIHTHKKELAAYIKKLKSQKNWLSIELNIGSGLLISYRK